MADNSKLFLNSEFPIDKVVYEVTTPLSYSVGAGATSTQTISNPHGKKAFVTQSWSIDGTNYYPMGAIITNPAVFYTILYTSMAWCDASNIYIYMENNSASGATFYIKLALDNIL